MDRNYGIINFISNYLYFKKAILKAAIFVETIKFVNKTLKTRKHKLWIKMQSISAFLAVAKFADFQWKNVDVSRTQEICHVIQKSFRPSQG